MPLPQAPRRRKGGGSLALDMSSCDYDPGQPACFLSLLIQKESRSLRASDLAKATQLGSRHAGIRPSWKTPAPPFPPGTEEERDRDQTTPPHPQLPSFSASKIPGSRTESPFRLGLD